MRDYDVAVIGSGGAGLSAAISACDAGASVIVLEADAGIGGSTALSGGVVYAAGTSVQRERGIVDSAEAMYDDYTTLNLGSVEPALVRRLCEDGADAIDWLTKLGVEFPPEHLYASGADRVPRGHLARGMGAAIVSALEQAAGARGIEVVAKTRVEEITTEGGRVSGLCAAGAGIQTAAIVIASGGFGHSPDLLRRLFPDAARHGDATWSVSAPCCRGDGLRLAEAIGASIVGANQGLLLPTPGFSRHFELTVPGWLLLVNREGRRFVDEAAAYVVLSTLISEQSGGSCFAIFDEDARLRAEPDPFFADAFAAGAVSLDWVSSVLEREAERGTVLRAGSPADLARAAGIEVAPFEGTLEAYNRACRSGEDPDYFKESGSLWPVEISPLHAVEIRPAIVCVTSTGPRIDPRARVLDEAGRPISGLYAAGEAAGGVLGRRYAGSGNSIASAVVFGRIAGANAAKGAATAG